MKLALLPGNRFNPWHFQAYRRLKGDPEIAVFRAESEIQERYDRCTDDAFPFAFERIDFDTQAGPLLRRLINAAGTRWLEREPRILPFHERLRGFDVLQSWELFTDWSAEALRAHERFGTPLAVMVWDNVPFNMERNPERRAMKERVAAGADLFVVHTQRSRRMLDVEGVPAGRIAFIKPGVDTNAFCPGPSKRDEFGLDDEDFVILFVGWFLPRKGIDFLLLALRELLHDSSVEPRRLKLMMVGSGPGRERVERLMDRLDVREACVFAGSLPYGRMRDAFRSADCFVLPSIATPTWQEQFGMALIEAMACGTPVVTTSSGAIPEIVGDCGLLCQPDDFVSLHAALRRLALEPSLRNDLAEAGRARALERFGLQRFADELSTLYVNLA